MRGLVFEGAGRIVLRDDLPDPVVEDPDDAVVAVEAAGLCGSDLHPYRGHEPARPGVVPGHEVVGIVTAVGDAVRRVRVGDRVVVPFSLSCGICGACRRGLTSRCERSRLLGWGDPDPDGPVLHGGQAEQVRVPLADGSLVAIGDELGAATALLLSDNLPTGWYAARRADVAPGDAVAVVGLGAVGLCAVTAALAQGADRVVAIDPAATRRDAAVALGAEARTPDAVEGLVVDAAIEAAGPPAAQRLAADLVRPGGTVSVIAVQTAPAFAIPPVQAYDRNLTIRAGRAPVRAILDELVPLVAAGDVRVPVAEVVTHPGRPLSEGPELYRGAAAADPGLVKATFDPSR
ncbi:alcohol dehydrogenase catalytic domain-containing protein [Euzebya sp.]|uniref:alcohol dehydrogenase catalytic domain-containing protein n=1 Tax=Euzebya sp. TaxID=1971409 RepID=UPI003515674F